MKGKIHRAIVLDQLTADRLSSKVPISRPANRSVVAAVGALFMLALRTAAVAVVLCSAIVMLLVGLVGTLMPRARVRRRRQPWGWKKLYYYD